MSTLHLIPDPLIHVAVWYQKNLDDMKINIFKTQWDKKVEK